MSKEQAQIWGPVLASLVAGASEITRAAIAARLRATADAVERHELVSDEAIDAAIEVADIIGTMQSERA
jgi:DNA-binding protein